MLTRGEKDMLYSSLAMRAGYIETGDPCLRAVDAEKMKKPIKALSIDQMKAILMIEDLMARILNNRIQEPFQSVPKPFQSDRLQRRKE